jgi:hypothetical protein
VTALIAWSIETARKRRVVDVPAGESPVQRSPFTVGCEMDLAGQAAPEASDRVVSGAWTSTGERC